MVDDLDYKGIKFLVSGKDYSWIYLQNSIFIILFWYENDLTYPVYVSKEKLKNFMDLLMITN